MWRQCFLCGNARPLLETLLPLSLPPHSTAMVGMGGAEVICIEILDMLVALLRTVLLGIWQWVQC